MAQGGYNGYVELDHCVVNDFSLDKGIAAGRYSLWYITYSSNISKSYLLPENSPCIGKEARIFYGIKNFFPLDYPFTDKRGRASGEIRLPR